MLVHLIADFGAHDLAFAEVAQRFKLYLPEAELVMSTVPPFATLAAGFCAAQLALGDAPPGTLVFHNVAPRRDVTAARRNNDGERLVYAEVPSGVKVVGVNAGYAFSFLRDQVRALHWVNVPSDGSQFRSRDNFPGACAAVVRGDAGALLGKLEPQQVPDIPQGVVAYIDGFGNLKTTLQVRDLPDVSEVSITLAGVTRKVLVADGSFSVPQGELCLAPGSSGWTGRSGERVRWLELFLRGGSAYEAFGRPELGERLEF
jgi:S-adenosylmethionine hydrolase